MIDAILCGVSCIIRDVDCVRLRKASGARLRHRGAIVEAGRATTHTDVQTRKRIIPKAVAAKGNRAIRLGTKHAVRHGAALVHPVHTYMPLTEYLAVLAIPKLAISGVPQGTIKVSNGAWCPNKKQHAAHWVTSTYLARPPAHGKQLGTLVSKVWRPLKLVTQTYSADSIAVLLESAKKFELGRLFKILDFARAGSHHCRVGP